MKHTVRKRKSTRIAYRSVGFVFIVLGIFLIISGVNGTGARFVKVAVGIAMAAYGFALVRASFKRSAYDATYVFGENQMVILQKKYSANIPYSALTGVNMVTPDAEMDYYILKLDRGKNSYVLPFAGNKEKCRKIFELVMEKSGINEEQDTGDIEK
jgi:hypothetical protein